MAQVPGPGLWPLVTTIHWYTTSLHHHRDCEPLVLGVSEREREMARAGMRRTVVYINMSQVNCLLEAGLEVVFV